MSLRIDNLTPAVKKVRTKTEEAQLTDEFLAFQNYYGFEVQACNPRSGHEKGSVENKVGYIRYNFFNKDPIMNSFEDLTTQLEKQLIDDRNRLHYEMNVLINELWDQEKKYLLQLPKEVYPVFKKEMGKVNKFNEINLDQGSIHVPKGANYSLLHIQLTWNTAKVFSPEGEILLDDYRPYMKKRKALPWVSIFRTWINKPRSVSYSRYKDYLPGRVKNYLLIDHLVIRRERLKAVAALLITHDMKRINEEFYELIAEEKLGKEENPFEINWL